MRIFTTPLIFICTVFFFGVAFQAVAQPGEPPAFHVDQLQNTCGPGDPTTGSLRVTIYAGDNTQDSLYIKAEVGVRKSDIIIKPIPASFPGTPIVVTLPGLSGGTSATGFVRTWLVTVADPDNTSTADNGTSFKIYNFQAALTTATNNTDPNCTSPNGAIDITTSKNAAQPTLPIIYEWTGPAGFTPPAFPGTEDLSGLIGGDYTLTYKDSNTPATGCSLPPIHINDPVPPSFTITSPSTATTFQVCENDAFVVKVDPTDATYTYTVMEGATMLSASTAGNGGELSLNVPALSLGSHTLHVEAKRGSCPAVSNAGSNLTVQVNAVPVYTGTTVAAICSSVATGINLNTFKNVTSVAATTFNIISITPQGGLTGPTSLPRSGGATLISGDQWVNKTAGMLSVDYVIEPGTPSCPGAQFTVTIPVNPQPDYNPYDNIAPAGVCSGVAIGVPNLDGLAKPSTLTATSYQLTALNATDLTAAGGSSYGALPVAITSTDLADDKWKNVQNGTRNVVYTIVPRVGTCAGDPFLVTVTINPEPLASLTNFTKTICSGDNVNFNLQTSAIDPGNGVTSAFDWTATDNADPKVTGEAVGAQTAITISDVLVNTSSTSQPVVYNVTPKGPGNCVGTSFTVTVTIDPEPVAPTLITKTICSGDNVNFNLQLDGVNLGNGVASTFDWTATDNIDPNVTGEAVGPQTATIINDVLVNTSSVVPQTVDYLVTPKSTAGCTGTQFTVRIRINPEPFSPTVGKGVCSGDVIDFNLQTLGVDLGNGVVSDFKWHAIDHPLVDGESLTDKPGDIVDDVLINNSPVAQNVNYIVTPTSLDGCEGQPFFFQVSLHPKPAYHDYIDAAGICAVALGIDLDGQKDPGSVLATSYDVEVVDFGLLTPAGGSPAIVKVFGATSGEIADDVWSNNTTGAIPVDYLITPNAAGCLGVPFHVTIDIKPQPDYAAGTASVCSGQPLLYDLNTTQNMSGVQATTFDVSFTPENGNVTPVSGVAAGIGNNMAINDDIWRNVTNASLHVTYHVVPTTAGCAGASFDIVVEVKPEPVYDGPTTPITLCSQDMVGLDLEDLKVSTSITAVSFEFTAIADLGLTAVGATNIHDTGNSMVIADDQWRNPTTGQLSVTYVIVGTTADGCKSTAAFDVVVVVDPEPDYNSFGDPSDPGICSTPLGIDLATLHNSTSVAAASFNISINAPGLTQIAGTTTPADLTDDVWQNLTGSFVIVTYTITPVSAAGCEGSIFSVIVKILPTPDYNVYDNDNAPGGVCSGDAIGVLSLDALAKPATVVADTYTVTDITIPAGVTSVSGIPATPFPYTVTSTDLADDVWKNTSNAAKDVVYKITPKAGTCDGTQFTVTVRINPEPVAPTNIPKSICSGDKVNFDLQLDAINLGNGLLGTGFKWVPVADNPDVSGEAIGIQSTPVIDDDLTNQTAVDQVVQYDVTPISSDNCEGAHFTVTITVKPRPVLVTSQTAEICTGSAVGYTILLTPANMPAGTTFSWQALDNPSVTNESLTPQTGNVITDVLVNTGVGAQTVTYNVTPFNGTCAGTPDVVTVTVNKAAIAEAGNNQTICTDHGAYRLGLGGASVGGAASTGKWTFISNPGNNGSIDLEGIDVANPEDANFSATVAGDYVLQLETDDPAGPCVKVTDVVTITVTQKPVITTPPLPKTICGNDAAAYSIQMTAVDLHALTVFTWPTPTDPTGAASAQVSPAGGVPMGTPGTIHINDILRNETGANIDIIYDVTPSVGLCIGAMVPITITVKPSPVVALNQTKTICSGERVDYEILLSPANTPAGTKFSWPDPDNTGTATSKLEIDADLVVPHITDTLFNDQATPQTIVYKVISQGVNGCYGAVRDIDIVVNPGAVVEAGPAQSICSGGTATLNGASVTGLVTTGTWSIDPSSPAGGIIDTSVSPPTFTATNAGVYKLQLTSADPGSCPAVSDVVTITVKSPGDASCTGSGGGSPCDKISVAPVWTAANCNNSDGSVHFEILDTDTGLPAVPVAGDVTITITGPTPGVNHITRDFNGLAVGVYNYEVEFGDATCVKTGNFTIDRSGTVGTPVATVVEEPACFGGTGTAVINAVDANGDPVATGIPLQWSLTGNGSDWVAFIGGGQVSGLPSGSNLIFVGRPGDACFGAVTITFDDPEAIDATLTPTDATCNNNDGSILVADLTGGTGPYTYILNGDPVNLPADNKFSGLTAGDYNIIITDSKSCFKAFNTVTISFPGFVNHTAPVTTEPDCTGGGSNGKVEFTITDPGNFEFAVTTDLVLEPTVYNQLGSSLVSIKDLARGDYAVWLRPVGAGVKCATKVSVSINGVYTVSYTASTSNVVCFAEPTGIVVDNITGAPALPYDYTLTNTNDNSVTTGTISASQALGAFSITGINKGNYSLLITQDQSSLVSCSTPINGGAIALVVDGPTSALDTLYVTKAISVPDLPSGSALVGVAPSGLEPYEVRLELTDPLFASQNFVADWTEVPVNPQNLKFEYSYTNLYSGVYTLGVRDAGGCEKTYVFSLDVDTQLFIPNIFTPNGDDHNEVFYIRNLPADSKLLVTNRWGKEVYKSAAYQNDWNGGDTVDGMYYYTLTLGDKSFTGWVEILRGR